MPHYSNYGSTRLSAQLFDELTGSFNALNETTNFRPSKGESISIVHPTFKTGYDTDSIDSLSETFGDGDPRILGPISGEGVFKPQDIDTKGSVIVGDNHFIPVRGGDFPSDNGGFDQVRRSDLEGQAFLREQFNYAYDFENEFEPAAGMNSFGKSLNPVAELGGTAGPGATSFLTGQFEMPTDNEGNPYPIPID